MKNNKTGNIRDNEYECIYKDSNSNSNSNNDKKREKGKSGEINNIERNKKKCNLSSKINKGGIGLYLNSIKKGLTTPTLPEWIILLNKRLYVRVFRVLGLYSSTTLLINSNKVFHLDYPLYLIVVFLILTTLNFIYYCWLNYHRIKHMVVVLRSEQLDVRNSPIRKIPSIIGRAYYCVKGACELGVGVGTGLGILMGVDALAISCKWKGINK